MRYIFLFMILFTMALNCLGQNPSSTPMPITVKSNSDVTELKKESPKNPVRLSSSLLKANDENYQMIVYLVGNDDDKLGNSKYQLKIYYREKLWRDLFEDEDVQQAALTVDGKLFPLSAVNSDVSKSKSQFSVGPNIRTQTLTFDILAEDVNLLSRAKSISIIWSKMNAEITPEGLTVLHQFIASENIPQKIQ